MKYQLLKIGSFFSVAILVSGCACHTRSATAHRNIEVGSVQGEKGYVEFHSVSNKAVIPIYWLDQDTRPQLISAIGLEHGDHYRFERVPVVVSERLNVRAPSGKSDFLVDKQGPLVSASVSEGKTIPVAISYKLIDEGSSFVIYRASAEVQNPVETPKTK